VVDPPLGTCTIVVGKVKFPLLDAKSKEPTMMGAPRVKFPLDACIV
jgi:hypothetical protein